MPTGNKGEWSEFYAFLKLIADQRVDAADANLEKVPGLFYPVLKLIREEAAGKFTYEFLDNNRLRILKDQEQPVVINIANVRNSVAQIFSEMMLATGSSFRVPSAEPMMALLRATRLNAGSARKEDIALEIHDHRTGSAHEVGFSIKSKIGSAPTLLNASAATGFIYKVSGIRIQDIGTINAINTNSKVRDRILQIISRGGNFKYERIASPIFEKNLQRIDTVLPHVVARLLLEFFQGMGNRLDNLVAAMGNEVRNICNVDLDRLDHEIKIKNFLYNIALGMVPDTPWNGLTRAQGGYIIVRTDGEIVCYHLYNADEFREYLYRNSKFDTASTARHGFGVLYEENGDIYIKLTLQVRFI